MGKPIRILVTVIIWGGVCGCESSHFYTGSHCPAVRLTSEVKDIRLYGNGTSEYEIAGLTEDGYLKERFKIPCSEERIQYLRSVLIALKTVGTPALSAPGAVRPAAVITVYQGGRIAATFSLTRSAVWASCLWTGLIDEFDAIASGDLAAGLMYVDIAEEYAKRDEWPLADSSYTTAAQCFRDWNQRRWDESGRAYPDDSSFLLAKPSALSKAGAYKEAVLAWRDACTSFTSGVTVVKKGSWREITAVKPGWMPNAEADAPPASQPHGGQR